MIKEKGVKKLQELHEAIYKNHQGQYYPQYQELIGELEAEGFRVEHGYGWYLHTPRGEVITIDTYNEEIINDAVRRN